jgi:alginate O-acetyltransferase complex protein AlgI
MVGKMGGALPDAGISWIVFTGFSFALVKIWTLLKDASAGQLRDVNTATVLAYLFHYPTFIAGPMYYFHEFQETLRRPQWPDGAGWVDVVFRIVVGFLKVKFLAPMLQPASLVTLVDAQEVTAGQLLAASLVYYLVIYLDFSGYSDLAIGATRAMGLKAPENFNRPYLAANIRDFWQRWHITFSRVLTSFIFVPVSRALTSRTGLGRIPVVVLSYTGTFVFCGFWHGGPANFLLWGLYHAAGLIWLDLYRPWATKRRLLQGASAVPAWRRITGHAVAVAVTFLFVSLGWIPFVLPIETMLRLASHLRGL